MDNDYLIALTDGLDRKSYAVLNPDPKGRIYAVEVTKRGDYTDIGIVERCNGQHHTTNDLGKVIGFAKDIGLDSNMGTGFYAANHLSKKRGLKGFTGDERDRQEGAKAVLWDSGYVNRDTTSVIQQLRNSTAISSDERVRVGVAKTVEALLADTPNLDQLSGILDRIAQASATSRPPIVREA